MFRKTKYSDDQLRDAIKKSFSWKDVCNFLGLAYAGGNVQTLKKKAKVNDINYAHFKGSGWNLGGLARNSVPLEKLLINGSTVKPSNLKHKLIKSGLKTNICEECGQGSIWNGKPLVLELDHINGNGKDNRIENLRILCLHCHSQTPTFRRSKQADVA